MRYVDSRLMGSSTNIDTARLFNPVVGIKLRSWAVIQRLFGYVFVHRTSILVDKHEYKVNGQRNEYRGHKAQRSGLFEIQMSNVEVKNRYTQHMHRTF